MRLAAPLALLASQAAADMVISATFIDPTTRYAHGVLGDAIEWGGLEIEVGPDASSRGTVTYRFTLPERLVYEDLEPRLWDVTGDGAPEVVVVMSDRDQGASLVIIGLVDDKPAVIAATPHIGQRNRWLAPVGAADLDGDGFVEIGYVDRPHLAKMLRLWRFTGDGFLEVARLEGLSNHLIGDAFIQSGQRQCDGQTQFVMASGDWSRVVAVTFSAGRIASSDLGLYTGPRSIEEAPGC